MGDVRATIARARKLRSNLTDAESYLWRHLRFRQIADHKFRRQRPIGPYIVDFVCLEKKVVIEVDGGQHAQTQTLDDTRDKWLRAHGYVVLRFWNNEVLREVEAIKEAILRALTEPPP